MLFTLAILALVAAAFLGGIAFVLLDERGDTHDLLTDINHQLQDHTMKLSELAANVNAAVTQIRKGTDEVLSKIDALKKQLENVELPAEAATALANLATAAQTLDDVVPDAPPQA